MTISAVGLYFSYCTTTNEVHNYSLEISKELNVILDYKKNIVLESTPLDVAKTHPADLVHSLRSRALQLEDYLDRAELLKMSCDHALEKPFGVLPSRYAFFSPTISRVQSRITQELDEVHKYFKIQARYAREDAKLAETIAHLTNTSDGHRIGITPSHRSRAKKIIENPELGLKTWVDFDTLKPSQILETVVAIYLAIQYGTTIDTVESTTGGAILDFWFQLVRDMRSIHAEELLNHPTSSDNDEGN